MKPPIAGFAEGAHNPPIAQDLSVSIVVPTFNRKASLERLLRCLSKQVSAGAPFEVLVVNDGSTDGTDAMLQTLQTPYALRTFEQHQSGPAAARNRALYEATGDILLFLDDDVVPTEGLVERHLSIHRNDPLAAVTGPMLAPTDAKLAPWLEWEAFTLQKQYDAMSAGRWLPTPRQFYTANASVRRTHALAAGGFDESIKRAEDVEFAYRLADRSVRFYFLAEAGVWHEPHRSFDAWLRVPYQYGQNAVRFGAEMGRGDIQDACKEWRTRHPLNRLLPRFCVGHTQRLAAAKAILSLAIRRVAPMMPRQVQTAMCSALFGLLYWQGVADASGLGACLWQDLPHFGRQRIDAPVAVASVASLSQAKTGGPAGQAQ